MAIVELSPDIYLISSTHHGTPGTAALHTLDMRSYDPADPTSFTVTPTLSLPRALFLNGACVLPTAPPSVLLADSYTASLYRVAFAAADAAAAPALSTWITHAVLAKTTADAAWPGVNGVKYHGGYVYATSSEARVFVRIPVDVADPAFPPRGPPEVLVRGTPGDDFVLDPEGTVAYVATNPNNSR